MWRVNKVSPLMRKASCPVIGYSEISTVGASLLAKIIREQARAHCGALSGSRVSKEGLKYPPTFDALAA